MNKLYNTRRVDFKSKFTISVNKIQLIVNTICCSCLSYKESKPSGRALGFGRPISCIMSNANETLCTF